MSSLVTVRSQGSSARNEEIGDHPGIIALLCHGERSIGADDSVFGGSVHHVCSSQHRQSLDGNLF
jgi:hypothetical protein